MKKTLFTFAALLLTVSSFAQLNNASFEDWYTTSQGENALTGWQHEVSSGQQAQSLHGTYRETNSQQGQYALKLSRWYNYTWDQVRQKAAINFAPGALTGHFTYTDAVVSTDSGKDTAAVAVYLTRWNSTTHQADTVGIGQIALSETPAYTAFSCPITYTSNLQPDSVTVLITPTRTSGQCLGGGWCSFLTIDNLSLSVLNATAAATSAPDAITLYPNPATSHFTLELNTPAPAHPVLVQVTDVQGRTVLHQQVSTTTGSTLQVPVSGLPAGLYTVQVITHEHAWQQKLVVQQ